MRFKALIEKAPDGIALIGSDGRSQYFSPSARNIFGYDLEEAAKADPLELIHPDDLGSVLSVMSDLIQNPAYAPTIQYRYKHKKGHYHWVESTFSNLLEDPSVQAVVINFRDITERMDIEKALFESERYYRALIENATDGILVVNTDGTIRYESPSVARILGYDPNTLIGTSDGRGQAWVFAPRRISFTA
jgi:PAS domain S-box-containing protein